MASTFGSQLATLNAQQEQGRVSRTQRIQSQEQQNQAKYRFEQARKEAERLKAEEFVDKDVSVEYQEQYVSEYRLARYSAKEWSRLSSRTRELLLAPYYRGYGIDHYVHEGKVVVNAYATRTATKTEKDPFTIEDYKNAYAKLSPDVQQFFVSPDEITTQQTQQKTIEKDKISSKITLWQQKIETTKQRSSEYQQWFARQSSKYRHDESNKRNYNKRLDDYDLAIAEYQNSMNYLNDQIGKIEEGYSASDLIFYAEDKANYDRQKQENKSKAIGEFNKSLSQGTLDADLIKLGLNKQGLTYNQFVSSIDKYNQNVSYVNQLKTWAGKVGFEKLPAFAQAKINPSATEWQQKYPTEKLIFDKVGNVVGVESGKLQQSIPIEKYNAIQEQERLKYEKLSGMAGGSTLKLGEKPSGISPSIVSADTFTPLTKEQQRMNEFYQSPSFLQRGFNFLKTSFGLNKQEATPPKIEMQEFSVAPTGMSGKGTLVKTSKFTPESSIYIGELYSFNQKADKLSEEIFKDYEKKLDQLTMAELTPEKLSKIKTEEQTKFNEQIKVYGEEFSKNYEQKIETLKRANVTNPLVKFYNNLVDQDKKLAGSVKVPTQVESEDQALKQFSINREGGMPVWLAKELAGGEEFGKGVYYGGKTAILENPRTFAFKTGAWTTAIAGATVISTYTGGLGGVATTPVMKWAGAGLLTLYGGSVVVRTAVPSTAYERGKTLGTIGGEEILPMGIGGVAGTYLGMKAVGGIDAVVFKYIKKYPYRASYKLTEMQLLKGEKNFPEISPHGSKAQMKAFNQLDKNFLTPDERMALKRGEKLGVISSHATASRTAFKSDQVTIANEGREINAMSVSNKRMSINFLDIRKSPSYSLYSGQIIPTGSAPLGLRIDLQGVKKIPKSYKPQLTRAELEQILGTKVHPAYFKKTAYLYEKGNFGTGYVAGIKKEVEAYLKGQGILKRTIKQKYYTGIANEKYYQSLEGISRKGLKEYISRVQKFSITKPNTWLDKIIPRLKNGELVFGRKAGAFKPMKKGRVVPYERFEALDQEVVSEKSLAQKIKDLLKERPRKEVVEILREKQLMETSKAVSSSSKGFAPKISASYPSSYAVELFSLSKSRKKSRSISYSASYSASYSSSLKSTIRSLLSSKVSSDKSYSSPSESVLSSSVISPEKYSYFKDAYYSTPSRPRSPKSSIKYLLGSSGLKQKIRKKMKKTPEIQGLFPDFTARSLGLSPKEMSVKQALKEMQKIQTGFEVRTGGRIKGHKPIDEKSLLKGIMK
jgi:hypothetical protein